MTQGPFHPVGNRFLSSCYFLFKCFIFFVQLSHTPISSLVVSKSLPLFPPQLEVRGCSVLVETVRSEEPGDTLKRERAEQKRLLADTHSAAMDLRCRLESSERGWVKEKSELLERFETERKQWENQLMDMQRKIEEVSLRMCATPHISAERTISCFK